MKNKPKKDKWHELPNQAGESKKNFQVGSFQSVE